MPEIVDPIAQAGAIIVKSGAAYGVRIDGVAALTRDVGYTALLDDAGRTGFNIGPAGDPTNHYVNTSHAFLSRAAASFATIDANGVTSTAGDFWTGGERLRARVTPQALADNGVFVVRASTSQSGELLVMADITGRFAAHGSVGLNGSTAYVGDAANASLFSTVKGTAGKINVYFEAGVGLAVQNMRGLAISFAYIWLGT